MNVEQALARIQELSDPRALAVWSRIYISPDRYLGANLTKLKELAKEIKKSHDLALALWETHIHDAKLLATMIEEPKKVTLEQINGQMEEVYSVDLADKYTTNVIAKTSFVQQKIDEWLTSDNEMKKRSAYNLICAQVKNDQRQPDSYFAQYLPTIQHDLQRERNWVKEMMNYAVIAIGSRSQELRAQAIAVAQAIGPVEVDYGDTSCKTTDALQKLTQLKQSAI